MTTATLSSLAAWVDLYRAAWASNDETDIRAAFTDAARYRGGPSAPPWEGIDAIVAGWQRHRDEPGTWRFQWRPVAMQGDVAVLQGETVYSAPGDTSAWDNLWVIRLAPDGRASDFTEWYVERE